MFNGCLRLARARRGWRGRGVSCVSFLVYFFLFFFAVFFFQFNSFSVFLLCFFFVFVLFFLSFLVFSFLFFLTFAHFAPSLGERGLEERGTKMRPRMRVSYAKALDVTDREGDNVLARRSHACKLVACFIFVKARINDRIATDQPRSKSRGTSNTAMISDASSHVDATDSKSAVLVRHAEL